METVVLIALVALSAWLLRNQSPALPGRTVDTSMGADAVGPTRTTTTIGPTRTTTTTEAAPSRAAGKRAIVQPATGEFKVTTHISKGPGGTSEGMDGYYGRLIAMIPAVGDFETADDIRYFIDAMNTDIRLSMFGPDPFFTAEQAYLESNHNRDTMRDAFYNYLRQRTHNAGLHLVSRMDFNHSGEYEAWSDTIVCPVGSFWFLIWYPYSDLQLLHERTGVVQHTEEGDHVYQIEPSIVAIEDGKRLEIEITHMVKPEPCEESSSLGGGSLSIGISKSTACGKGDGGLFWDWTY